MPMNSCDLGGVNKYCFTESATAWRLITVKHPGIIAPLIGATASTIYVVPCRPPNALAVSLSEVIPADMGYVYLPAPGDYWVNLPVVGSAAAERCFVYIDCGSPEGAVAMLKVLKFQKSLLVNSAGLTADLADATANGDFIQTLVGLVTNSRLAFYDEGTYADWKRWAGKIVSEATGTGHAAWGGPYGLSAIFGRDTSDNTMRALETRASSGAQVAALYRLLVDAANRGYYTSAVGYEPIGSTREIAGTVVDALHQYIPRESAYVASFYGRRFVMSGEGNASPLTNGFAATAPSVVVVAGAMSEFIVRKISAALGVVAGTPPAFARLVIDTANRYSSGGTSRTAFNKNGGSATASALAQVRDNAVAIVATAAGAGTREMGEKPFENVVGKGVEWYEEDGLIIPAGGSLLLYCHAGAATGSVRWMIEGEEANVQ